MEIKNKIYFTEERLIWFVGGRGDYSGNAPSAAPHVRESELSSIKSLKEEAGAELDTEKLAQSANALIQKRQAQLERLSPEFNAKLHDEIVRYFLQSPERYDQDQKKGLSVQEFAQYRDEMLAKVEELMKQYAPTEKEQRHMEEAKENVEASAEKAQEKAESIKAIELQDIPESPGEIPDTETLGAKFDSYENLSSNLQKEAGVSISLTGDFQKAYGVFQEARGGFKAYRNFLGYFAPGRDTGRLELEKMHSQAQAKIQANIEKLQQARIKLEKYGEALGNASNKLKQSKIVEREQKIKEIDEREKERIEAKAKKERERALMKEKQENLAAKRQKLEEYRKILAEKQENLRTTQEDSRTRKEKLTNETEMFQKEAERIDLALANPNISAEEREQLEKAKEEINEKSREGSAEQSALEQKLALADEDSDLLRDEEGTFEKQITTIKYNLEHRVNPELLKLEKDIAVLEEAKSHYAKSKEEVTVHYENASNTYDTIDKSVDDAVLKNNLTNVQLYEQLAAQKKILDEIKVERPSGITGLLQATIGIPLSMVGAGLGATGKWILKQGEELARELERSRAEMGRFTYIAARIGAEIINAPIGVAGGLIEMAGGVVSLVAHPIDTGKGLAAMIGRDPTTGKWALGRAGNTWKTIGKAIISYDEFKEGHIGLAIGKIFPNVVLAISIGGAATAGKASTQAAYAAARQAGMTASQALAKASVAFAKGAGGELIETAKVAKKFVASAPGAAKGVKTFVAGAEGQRNILARSAEGFHLAAKNATAGGIRALPGKMLEATKEAGKATGSLLKSGAESVAVKVERLWGGKKLEDVRTRKLAEKELSLVEDISKSTERYSEYKAELQKLREANPGLSEAALRQKMSTGSLKQVKLYADASKYEQKLATLERIQKDFDKAVVSGTKNPDNAVELEQLLKAKNAAQRGMIDSFKEYARFKKLLESNDPRATQIAREFEEALASGKNLTPEYMKTVPADLRAAPKYLEHQYNYKARAYEIRFTQMFDTVQTLAVDQRKLLHFIVDGGKRATLPEEIYLLNDVLAKGCLEGLVDPQMLLIAIEKGKLIPNELSIPFLIKTPKGSMLVERLIELGKAPVTREWIENFIQSEYGFRKMEEWLNMKAVRFEKGLTREDMLARLKNEKQMFVDQKIIRVFRDPAHPEKLDELKELVRDNIRHIEAGESVDNEIARILKGIKENDPDGYQMIVHGDIETLINTECFEGIVLGNKVKFVDSKGESVVGFFGKHAGQGTFGAVHRIVYRAHGDDKVHFAVAKQPFEKGNSVFAQEIEGASQIQHWNHPNIIQPLHISPDIIIYESSEIALDLFDARAKALPAEEYLIYLRQALDGLIEYRKRGLLHGDVKPGNVLVLKTGTDEFGKNLYTAKLIDNTPHPYNEMIVPNTDAVFQTWACTPNHSFTIEAFAQKYNELLSSGITKQEAVQTLGRAVDAYSYGVMLRNTFNRYLPEWTEDTGISTMLNTLLDPLTGGRPGALEFAAQSLDKVIENLRSQPKRTASLHEIENAPTVAPSFPLPPQ